MELTLQKTQHPNRKDHLIRYENLIGMDTQKAELLMTLQMILDKKRLAAWEKKHHSKQLPFLQKGLQLNPLIILSGEVGCGKTVLAQTVATPLANLLDMPITTLQTPSDIRGFGMVGQLSSRITAAFSQAKNTIGKGYGILIIDEGDDLASSRSQMQSHHEDKAGVNVLIKEIDAIETDNTNMAVILITNRMSSLDSAVIRRACLHLEFHRPTSDDLGALFQHVLEGTEYTDGDIQKLSKVAGSKDVPFSYSDIFQRVAKQAMLKAIANDVPFGPKVLLEVLEKTIPTPLID